MPTNTRGKERVDDRRVISGIIHVLKSGGRWIDAPADYRPRKTLYNRFVCWAEKEVCARLFESLAQSGGPVLQLMIDSSAANAHRSAAGGNVWPAPPASDLFQMDKTICENVSGLSAGLLARKARKYSIPDQPPVSAEAVLADEKWRRVNWRRGTKGRLTCLFAARRVRIADGHKHRMLDDRMQCMPGDQVWLVGERRSTGEQKYYVSNLPADTSLKTLAATIKARWVCEQAHQQTLALQLLDLPWESGELF